MEGLIELYIKASLLFDYILPVAVAVIIISVALARLIATLVAGRKGGP